MDFSGKRWINCLDSVLMIVIVEQKEICIVVINVFNVDCNFFSKKWKSD